MQAERTIDPDGVVLFLAALVRQAVLDYRSGYTRHGTPAARVFLRAADLLASDGTLDTRLRHTPQHHDRLTPPAHIAPALPH